MTRILEKLGPRIRDEIREAIASSMVSGEHRVPRHRFNKKTPARERNAFTHEFIEHLSWLDSREGRSQATSSGYQTISILAAVIEMTLLHAHEKGLAPLQVLELGTRRARSILSSPQDLSMVEDLMGLILDEADEQHEAAMIRVEFVPATDRKMKPSAEYLKGIEGEYRLGVDAGRSDVSWVHFERPDEADGFRAVLIESGVEILDGHAPPDDAEAAYDFSPLKLSVMRAIWTHSPLGSADFHEVLEAVSDPSCRRAIARIGIQADAVLDAIAKPNDDMVLGGCLEADPIGALVEYDPAQSRTQEDVSAVYEAMMKEGRERNNRSRRLRKTSQPRA